MYAVTPGEGIKVPVVGRLRWEVVAGLAAAVLVLDLGTKRAIRGTLALGESRDLLPFLELRHHANDGAAFGLLSGRQSFILVAVGLAMAAVVAYVFLDRRLVAAVAGGLLVGGSLGNLVERVAYGRVTDFLQLPHYPTFNVADIFIVAGVGLMAITLVRDYLRGPSEGGSADA